MTVADKYLAEIGSALDALPIPEPEPWSDAFAEASGLREAVQPIVSIAIALGVRPSPGSDREQDATWAASVALARRDVLDLQAAGIDHGLATDNLRLLERIDELVDNFPDRDRDELARRRVSELVDARRRGRARGIALRASDPHSDVKQDLPRGWLLRHPTDHWLRGAVPTVTDPGCRSLMEVQIEKLAASYKRLCELDWSAEQAAAEVICEVRVPETPAGWKQPVSAVAIRSLKGTPPHERVTIGLVEDLAARPFNGTLVSVLADEGWLICARPREDGALLPLDGTRRLRVENKRP